MLAIAILAAAAGLALGLRFSAATLALLALAIVLTFAICLLGDVGPVVFAFKMLTVLASIQVSYLFGCLLAAHFPTRAKTLDRAPM